jgi:hypothetical protein
MFANGTKRWVVEGQLVGPLDIAGKHSALVENAIEFGFVPLAPIYEKKLGDSISRIMRTDGVSWRIGRAPCGPTISL